MLKVHFITDDIFNSRRRPEWCQGFTFPPAKNLSHTFRNFYLLIRNLSAAEFVILKRVTAHLEGECLCDASSGRALIIGGEPIYQRLGTELSREETVVRALGAEIISALNKIDHTQHSIGAGKYQWDLSTRTMIMGILNVTPDSFSDGGRYFEAEKALQRGMEMMKGGADIIDVGGESTRPGAEPVSITEELDRVLPVIEGLVSQGIPVSIDTYKAEVARQAVEAGAVAINDISGMHFEPEIADITARNRTLLILMHIQGTPRDMQKNPQYRDLIGEMLDYLDEGVNCATEAGVERKKIIIDPGIGFGKNLEHNLEILRRLREFKVLGLPILVGVSRKSFIGAILNKPVEERLYGTCSACALAIANGADILRVHDPEQIRQVAQIADGITGKFPSSDAG